MATGASLMLKKKKKKSTQVPHNLCWVKYVFNQSDGAAELMQNTPVYLKPSVCVLPVM